MAPVSIELKLRVILVTTRAALRHADRDSEDRRAILRRGRDLVESLATRAGPGADGAIERARAELDELERT